MKLLEAVRKKLPLRLIFRWFKRDEVADGLGIPEEYIAAFLAGDQEKHLLFNCRHADVIEEAIKANRKRPGGSQPNEIHWNLVHEIKQEGCHKYAERKLQEHKAAMAAAPGARPVPGWVTIPK